MPAASAPTPKTLLVVARVLLSLLLVTLAVLATRLDFRQPFLGYGLGGTFLFFLATRPSSRRKSVVWAVAIVAAALVRVWQVGDIATLLVQGMGCLGLASLLTLSCAVLWNGRAQEQAAYRALLPGVVLTFLILAAMHSLNMAALLHAKTFDLYAYAFDGSLGFQPSFLLGGVLDKNPWLFLAVKVTYEGIVLAMAATYAVLMIRQEKPVWEVIEFLFAPAMIGYLFFSVFPVCGPHYAFAQDFPHAYLSYSTLHHLLLERVSVSRAFPRNGVPSLHMAWALMIWLNTRGLPRAVRRTTAALVLATVFDTLATGEHYLFDLIVTLPFTLWMQASLLRRVSFRKRQRWLPAITGCAIFLSWLAIGRFGIQWMLTSRFVPWSLTIISSTLSLRWSMRLPAIVPQGHDDPELELRAMAAAAR